MKYNTLVSNILIWYKQNARNLPWRHTKDPYKIWLSEIILQQTRVAQGLPYYLKFVERYPDIISFANASEDEILHLWQGLGYYSRGRNMHHCARTIIREHSGEFPKTYTELRKLKGIGDYTAAAISSFAFDEKKPAVDGNIIRVMSRLFGIFDTPHSKESKKSVELFSNNLMENAPPADYNQAMMEFGALQCIPRNPDCGICPVADFCFALKHNSVTKLPAPSKKIEIKNRYFYFLVIHHKQKIYLQKRTANDIWKNLYQFPLIETHNAESETEPLVVEFLKSENFIINNISPFYEHKLTHRIIHAKFIDLTITNEIDNEDFILEKEENIMNYAFPKLIHLYLNSKNNRLNLNLF